MLLLSSSISSNHIFDCKNNKKITFLLFARPVYKVLHPFQDSFFVCDFVLQVRHPHLVERDTRLELHDNGSLSKTPCSVCIPLVQPFAVCQHIYKTRNRQMVASSRDDFHHRRFPDGITRLGRFVIYGITHFKEP